MGAAALVCHSTLDFPGAFWVDFPKPGEMVIMDINFRILLCCGRFCPEPELGRDCSG